MMELRATRIPHTWGDGIEIRMIDQENKTFVESVQLHTVKPEENGPISIPAAVTLTMHHAQSLMDQLWDCGLRPTEGTGSAGALAAVEKHLTDMRKVAFHALNIK